MTRVPSSEKTVAFSAMTKTTSWASSPSASSRFSTPSVSFQVSPFFSSSPAKATSSPPMTRTPSSWMIVSSASPAFTVEQKPTWRSLISSPATSMTSTSPSKHPLTTSPFFSRSPSTLIVPKNGTVASASTDRA